MNTDKTLAKIDNACDKISEKYGIFEEDLREIKEDLKKLEKSVLEFYKSKEMEASQPPPRDSTFGAYLGKHVLYPLTGVLVDIHDNAALIIMNVVVFGGIILWATR